MNSVRVHDSRIRRFLNIIRDGATSTSPVLVRCDGKIVTFSAECKGMTRINYEIDRCDKLGVSIFSGIRQTSKFELKNVLGEPKGLGYYLDSGSFIWIIEGMCNEREVGLPYQVEKQLNSSLPRCEFGIDAGVFHTVLKRALPFIDETDDKDRGLDTVLLEITKDHMTIIASTGVVLSVEKMHVLSPRVMPKSMPKIRLTLGYWVAKAYCKALGYHSRDYRDSQVYFRLMPSSDVTTKEDGFIMPSSYVLQYGPISIYSECKVTRATAHETVFKGIVDSAFHNITPGGINQLWGLCKNGDSRDYITLSNASGCIEYTYKSYLKTTTYHGGIDGSINTRILLNPARLKTILASLVGLTENTKVRVVSDGKDPNVLIVRYGNRTMALAAMKG